MAWHGLTTVKPDLTLENCALNAWDYVKNPVKVISNGREFVSTFESLGVSDVEGLEIGDHFNPDTFKPLTNKRFLELLGEGLEGSEGAELASVGTFGNRAKQFAAFYLGDLKGAGREFKAYLNAGNGNDQSDALWINTSNICTVCANTYAANKLSKGFIMQVKKTKFSELRIDNAGDLIRDALGVQREFAREFEAMGLVSISESDARAVYAYFVGSKGKALSSRSENVVEELVRLFKHGRGNEGKNVADLFSGITDYWTHQASKDITKNVASSEFGIGAQRKEQFFALCKAYQSDPSFVAMGNEILQETLRAAREKTQADA